MLEQVSQLSAMLAANPLAVVLGVFLIASGMAATTLWQYYTGRVARRDEIEDRGTLMDMAREFSAALASQTEINRQQSTQMEAVGIGLKELVQSVKLMHQAQLRNYRTQGERLNRIEEDLKELKHKHSMVA